MVIDFEQIPHTADIKIRVYGATLQELFVHALQGMFHSAHPIIVGASWVHDRIVCLSLDRIHTVTMSAPDREVLLVDFLSYALYLSDVHNEAYLDAQFFQLTETSLHAQLRGAQVQGFQGVELKAVTYHDLAIIYTNNRWQTDIVFDI